MDKLPIFNVADIFITVFCLVFILVVLFGGKREEEDYDEEDEDEEITLKFEDGEVVVTVFATKKILNGATRVNAKKITGGEVFEDIEASLEEKAEKLGEELVAFKAYDITLLNDDGDEVHPKDGNVKVTISKVEASVDDESLEGANVSLVHFEKQSGDSREMVDLTNRGSTSLDTGSDISTVNAEFVTDSFSPFVISWSVPSTANNLGGIRFYVPGKKKGQRVNIYAVDQDGKAIDATARGEFDYVAEAERGLEQISDFSAINGDYFAGLAERKVNAGGLKFMGAYITDANQYNQGGNNTQISNIRFHSYSQDSAAWQFQQVGNNNWSWDRQSNYIPRTDNVNSAVDVFLVYDSRKPAEDDHVFYGNLFNYDRDVMNNWAQSRAGGSNRFLIFHDAGDLPNQNDGNNIYNTKWNSCNTVNNDDGNATAYQGIVKNTLNNNGLPNFNFTAPPMFSPSDSIFKNNNNSRAYTNVAIPFYMEDGYYTFEARNKNTYEFKQDTKTIERYEDSSSTGYWPFGENDIHFGMDMQVFFNIPEDGLAANGSHTKFSFAGDDDVWVFIDNKLALDMGGVHESVNGSIDFKTGECEVINAYNESKNVNRGRETRNLYTDVLGYRSVEEGIKALASGSHTLSFFYVERGGSQSNCKIQFNFNTTNETELTDVFFKKTDETGKLLPGAEFGLFPFVEEGQEDEDAEALYSAVSDEEGIVKFKEVAAGKYILKETKAPIVTLDDGTIVEYEPIEVKYIVEVKNAKIVTEAGRSRVVEPGSFNIYEASDSSKKQVDTIENQPKHDYRKKITIIKEWEDDNSSSRPGSVEFHIQGSFPDDDGSIKYVNADETASSNPAEVYKTVVISASDGWRKTVEDIPVFFDGDKDKLITWSVQEIKVRGYRTEGPYKEFDESSAIAFESDVDPVIPAPAPTGGDRQFEHIDIEYYGASDSNSTNKRVEGIQDINGSQNRITVIGYYNSYSGYTNNNNSWVRGTKSVASNESNGDGEWRATGVFTGTNTAVAFKVKFNDTDDYKLVVIQDGDTYPDGTYLVRNKQFDNAQVADYYRKAYTAIANYYGINENSPRIDLSGKNIFTVAEIVCPATSTNQGNIWANGYGSPGLDFVLSPNTIEKNIVEPRTGNETYRFKNIKDTVSLTFEKTVTYPGQVDPRLDALYCFKIERINELDGSVIEVIGEETPGISISTTGFVPSNGRRIIKPGYKNGIFSIYAGQTVTLDKLPFGKYRVTEIGGYYNNQQISFKEFTTKIYYVDVNGNGKVVKEYLDDKAERAYDVDFSLADSQHIKFENNFKREFRWKVVKRSKNSQNTLANAEFELDDVNTGVTLYYGISNSEGEIQWYNSYWEVENHDDPKANPLTVGDGTYLLKETKAPAGFAISDEQWIITYEKATGVVVKTTAGKVVTPASSSSEDGNVITYSYNFLDEVVYSLPETGGRGVYIYTIGGVLLLLGAVLLLYKNKKQK